ncbi:hypothetical protein SCACP_39950 [Sporomusa carbonis]|uniref:hypothetical protein n=1 Tax=Sporomusa carbonis TaxID=3076075 RepID=UPI003A6AC9E2
MDDTRLDRVEKMLEQLIQMVGHNNAVTEELRQQMDSMETRINSMEAKLDNLEAKMEKGVVDVVNMVNLLGTKVDKIDSTFGKHSDILDVLSSRSIRHEAAISRLELVK